MKIEEIMKIALSVATIMLIELAIMMPFIIAGKLQNNKYDVNGDGKVTPADYIEIKNYIMEEQ